MADPSMPAGGPPMGNSPMGPPPPGFMPTLPPPVNPSDLGRGPMIMGISWFLTIVAIVVVSFRLYVRFRVPKSSGWDDWFMGAALILQIFHQACLTEAFTHGLGKRDMNLTLLQLIDIAKWNWISTVPAFLVPICARISAAILLIRIFRNKVWFKWYLIIFTGIQTVAAIVVLILHWAQASPIEGLWNPFIVARRWPQSVTNIGTYVVGSFFAWSDLTYVIFPIMMIWKLNMPKKQKVGLSLLLATSLITAAASILKTITTQIDKSGRTPDIQYKLSLTMLYSNLEQTLVIIMTCIPPLRTALQDSFIMKRISEFSSALSSKIRGFESGYSSDGGVSKESTKVSMLESTGSSTKSPAQVHVGAGSRWGVGMDSRSHKIQRTDEYEVTYARAETRRPRDMV